MIKDVLKDAAQRAAGRVSAGLSLLGDRAGDRIGILMYHRVAPRVAGVEEPSINVTPSSFRRQLTGLLQCGYRFESLSRMLEYRRAGERPPAKSVVITFDDGHQTVFSEAWPVLRELNAPATVFLNTAFLDSTEPFPFDRWSREYHGRVPAASTLPLTLAQCREMSSSGLIEWGAHTHTHGDFRGRPAEFEKDLQQSVDLVREYFGNDRVSFAFPFGRRHLGYVDDALLNAARRTGVACALTTECELVDASADPFGWGRFNIYDWDDATTIAARLRGWYGWGPRWQARLAGLRSLLFPRARPAL